MPTTKAFSNESDTEAQYISLLKRCMKEGYIGHNKRTNSPVESLIGVRIAVNDADVLPMMRTRRLSLKVASAELAWTISGEKDISLISTYSPMWDKFAVNGQVEAAYGHRWRHHFGRDQLHHCLKALTQDPTSRQAVVMAWDPGQDGLLNIGTMKNVPCPLGFQAVIAGNMLHLHVFQRSADLVLGLPYDMLMYSLLNCAMAKTLGIYPGQVIFSITNAHIYGYLKETAEKQCLAYDSLKPEQSYSYEVPSISEIESDYGKFIAMMAMQAREHYRPIWEAPRLEPLP